jgi:hypothetical protein
VPNGAPKGLTMVLWKVGTLQTPDSLTCALSNHADAGIPECIDDGALLCRAAARSKRSGRVVASHCSERRNTSDDIDAQGHRTAQPLLAFGEHRGRVRGNMRDKLDPHAVGGSFPDGDHRFDAVQLRLRIDVGVAADRSRVMPAIASATEADQRVRSGGTQRRQSPDGLGLDEVLAIIR